MRISDWSSDVCSSDLMIFRARGKRAPRLGDQVASKLAPRLVDPAPTKLVKARDVQIVDPLALLAQVIRKAAVIAHQQRSEPFAGCPHRLFAGNQGLARPGAPADRSEEHTSELQS